MAVTDAYATAAEYRARISKSSTDDDTELDLDLRAISDYISRRVGRNFEVDATDSTRIFSRRAGAHPRRLWVDDLSADPTSITIDADRDGSFADDTALAATDYQLQPVNAPTGRESEPYTKLWIPTWSSKGEWPAGYPVQVVGLFGWPSVPAAVQAATIELTAIWRLESPRATERVSEMGELTRVSQEAARIVKSLQDVYRRVYL